MTTELTALVAVPDQLSIKDTLDALSRPLFPARIGPHQVTRLPQRGVTRWEEIPILGAECEDCVDDHRHRRAAGQTPSRPHLAARRRIRSSTDGPDVDGPDVRLFCLVCADKQQDLERTADQLHHQVS